VDWQGVLLQSGFFLGIQHGVRIWYESGTRRELKGKFWKDYVSSVTGLSGWGDGDPWKVNYVAHPVQGAITGFIWIQNDRKYTKLRFNESRSYWIGQARALGWSAFMSTQFELGPISEASIGNVGMRSQNMALVNGGMGWVDLVMTPVGGAAVMIAEDMIDWHIIRKLESRTNSVFWKAVFRGALNPSRTAANAMRFKLPWHRDNRPGVTKPSTIAASPRPAATTSAPASGSHPNQ
jgi:hypothetical protein